MRYHLTPVRMAIINKSTNNEYCEDEEKGEHFSTIGGQQVGAATVESSMERPQKIKNRNA